MTEDEFHELPYLPKKGVCGTLYLYFQPWGRWGVVTWDGRRYHCHGQTKEDPIEGNYMAYEQIVEYADRLGWAESWPRVTCRSVPKTINPCVRVEIEYKDGRIQRLTGYQAEKWLKNVNDIVAAGELRYGQTQMNDYPWEFARKED